ncbi:MAG TPA: glycoside hydrolase family 38 C-terminal domain-containing protein [Candidatus Acidoferrales bacterium]|nr:glycoside hydrolase family 38 C-terminal domain-containing protein [Candidatus Acidoferrales bacterium]
MKISIAGLLVFLSLQASATAQSTPPNADSALPSATIAARTDAGRPQPGGFAPRDLTRQPTLYLVGYAHLDTQWRWEYPQVISEFLPKTLDDNFTLFRKYPHYVFNFTGANRYRMMKEYFPADYALLKQYVAAGRWFPAGSSVEESDVNSPSAESIIRQILYGNEFFRHEFRKASIEYMLPDCFGFPASLPSILAHAGIKGFSTQKLTWGSAAAVGGPGSPEDTPPGIPFNVGLWVGPDGRGVIAALNPGSYDGDVTEDLTASQTWLKRVELDGTVSRLFADYHYYGTGDTGGAPREFSVKLVDAMAGGGLAPLPPPRQSGESMSRYVERVSAAGGAAIRVGEGPLHVVSSQADQMFFDILAAGATARLPRYRGDLLLTNHSAGSLTSEAYQKRWNRKNELLADAAERASVAAAWLGGRSYPLARLNRAWMLVLGGQFHDIMAGTATPKAYEYSWNDDVLAMNQFSIALESAVEAVASLLDTEVSGTPVVVYNPLAIARQDVVEATLAFPGGVPPAVRVFGPDGKEVPAQLEGRTGGMPKIVFLARVPSAGFAVYDVRSARGPAPASPLKITSSSLENARYRIRLDPNGDVASIFDKALRRELLSSPARLAFQTEKPHDWPAWNMDWADQQKPARSYVRGPATLRIVENGPARVALQIERKAEGSRFVQVIRLSAGDAGNRVEFLNAIDWRTAAAALKAAFPLTASNREATYNWDVGTVLRGNNDEKKFEVPSHQWFDLTDKSGGFGVTILSDCKYGSDKPDGHTLRLTLLYTPGLGAGNGRYYSDQTSQDWGHHEFLYGLASHSRGWRQAGTDWQAYRLNDPLIAFTTTPHSGRLGNSLSLVRVSNSRIRVLALKKAEESDEVIVRVVEMSGLPEPGVRIGLAAPIVAAREVNGQEMPVGPTTIERGALVASFGPYQIRTFAVKLGPPPAKAAPPAWQAVSLPYDRAVASADGAKAAPGFDDSGESLPAEMLPTDIPYAGIHFQLAPAVAGRPDAVAAHGQTIPLPPGRFNRLYILAASAAGDRQATFRVGDRPVELKIEDWGGYIGQWDDREWSRKEVPVPPRPGVPARTRLEQDFTGKIAPGFIKRAPVAWFASHRHTAAGANEPYAYSYLFAYALDLPPGAATLTFPNDDKIRILAVTVAGQSAAVRPVQPLYDTLDRSGPQPSASIAEPQAKQP